MDSSWAQKVDMIHIEQQFYKLNLFSTQVVWFEVTIKDPEDDYYDYEYGLGELFHPPRGSIDQPVNNSTHSCHNDFDVKTLILNFHFIFIWISFSRVWGLWGDEV